MGSFKSRLHQTLPPIIADVLRKEAVILNGVGLSFTSHPESAAMVSDSFIDVGPDKQTENMYLVPILGQVLPDILTKDVIQDTTTNQRYNVVGSVVIGNLSSTLRIPVEKVLQ